MASSKTRLIGADGRHSRRRKALGKPDLQQRRTGQRERELSFEGACMCACNFVAIHPIR